MLFGGWPAIYFPWSFLVFVSGEVLSSGVFESAKYHPVLSSDELASQDFKVCLMRNSLVLGKLLDPVIEDGQNYFSDLTVNFASGNARALQGRSGNAIFADGEHHQWHSPVPWCASGPQEWKADLSAAMATFQKEHLKTVLQLTKLSVKHLTTLQVLATWFVWCGWATWRLGNFHQLVFCFLQTLFDIGDEILSSYTHWIHVWYIYLHLPYKSTKCRWICHTWILRDMV